MADTKTSKKRKAQKQRHKGIKGLKENEDYIHVRTRNQEYLVYIPLHDEAARIIASVHIGNCHGKWCIANSQARQYYRTQAKRPGKIPVMVIGNGQKYTVMVHKDNKNWEVWDKENVSATHGEDIPNFSIKKELMTSKLAKLYDDIRTDIWKKRSIIKTGDPEYDAAVNDYEKLAEAIEEYVDQHEDARDEWYQETERIKKETIEKYEKLAFEAEKEADYHITGAHAPFERNVANFKLAMKRKPEGDRINNGEKEWLISNERGEDSYESSGGVYYNEREIDLYIDTYKKEFANSKKEPDYDLRDMYNDIVETIESTEDYELYHLDYRWKGERFEIEWTDYLPDEESSTYEIYPPDSESRDYEDYFDFFEEHDPEGFDDFDHEHLRMGMYELPSWGGEIDGRATLEENDAPHPEEIVANMNDDE